MLFIAMICGNAPEVCSAQSRSGYGDYMQWDEWPRLRPGVQAGLASSYDRDGLNRDYNYYEAPTGFITTDQIVTVRTIQGPGIIYRFWMPHRNARDDYIVRMYFDGESVPRIDTRSEQLLTGAFSWFAAPLLTTSAGGQVCYETIPFQNSVRIEGENIGVGRNYYQYSYLIFPPGTQIESYSGSLTPAEQDARTATVALFNNAGQHPAGSSSTAVLLDTPATSIAAGDCLTLADVAGPGLVRRLNVRMDAATDAEPNGLLLRITYDGYTQPAIDVAVAHFFGAGSQRALYRSIPLGTDSPDGFYSYWPMPFHRSIRIVLCNTTAAAIVIDSAAVEYESQPIDPDMGYLHAHVESTTRATGTQYHPMLSATGCGHYVGNLLYLQQATNNFTILEGDEIVTIDGTRILNGTGTEDAYNGGYYYNWVGIQDDEPEGPMPQSVIRPLHGALYVHRNATPITRADQYRWQIADRIPFSRSIDFKIEASYADPGATFTSVAFWYQLPPVPGDDDHDCDVDADDVAHFLSCVSGPTILQTDPACLTCDHDGDGDTDQDDFGTLQRCLSGADVLGNPTCAD